MKIKLIQGCSRCGKDHTNLNFNKLTNSIYYWCMCPVISQPILMEVRTVPETTPPQSPSDVSKND